MPMQCMGMRTSKIDSNRVTVCFPPSLARPGFGHYQLAACPTGLWPLSTSCSSVLHTVLSEFRSRRHHPRGSIETFPKFGGPPSKTCICEGPPRKCLTLLCTTCPVIIEPFHWGCDMTVRLWVCVFLLSGNCTELTHNLQVQYSMQTCWIAGCCLLAFPPAG